MKSWYSQMACAARNVSGSWRASQSAFGTIHSADTGLCPPPFTRSAGLPVACTASASAPARTSIQMIAGRSGRPCGSSATTLQQVVVWHSAAMLSGATPLAATAPRTEAASAVHHASGSCSARAPGAKCVA